MPPRFVEERLRDMLEASEKISRYIAGLTYESFCGDEKTIDAVIKNLIVLGEAANSIPADIQAKHSELPWNEMRALRNVIIHEYFGTSTSILWKTATEDLPPLITPLKALIEKSTIPG